MDTLMLVGISAINLLFWSSVYLEIKQECKKQKVSRFHELVRDSSNLHILDGIFLGTITMVGTFISVISSYTGK